MFKDVEYERFIEVVTEKESNPIAYARLVGILVIALKYGDSVEKVNATIEHFTKQSELGHLI